MLSKKPCGRTARSKRTALPCTQSLYPDGMNLCWRGRRSS
nr:MAG TPA_asm: hypothetical protein [Caudoviricetes sp.]